MTYVEISLEPRRIRASVDMGNRLKTSASAVDRRALALTRLRQLSPCELRICLMHLLEGHSQVQVAEWLGITLRTVQRHITRAILKVPELKPLRTKSLLKPPRPKICAFSQLKGGERGPFNPDEI